MVLLMNNLKNVYGKLNNLTCVVGLMLGGIHKKQQSQKCDQEPIFKIYWSCLLAKKILFAKSKRPYQWDPWINIAKLLNVSIVQAKRSMQDKSRVISPDWLII